MFALERISFQLKSKLGHSLYTLTKQTMTAVDRYVQVTHNGSLKHTKDVETIVSTYLADWCEACDKVIFEETGIDVKMTVDSSMSEMSLYNAFMYPDVDKVSEKAIIDSVMGMSHRASLGNHEDDPVEALVTLDANLGKIKKAPKGYKVHISLNISFFLLKYFEKFKDIQAFNPQQIAAIIVHEIGHGFTFLEYVGRIVAETTAFRDRVELLSKTPSKLASVTHNTVLKYVKDPKLIKEYETLINDSSKLPPEQSAYMNSLTLTSLVTKLIASSHFAQVPEALQWAGVKPLYSDQVYTPYMRTMTERVADEFATSHGLGQPLAEALRIIFQFHKDRTDAMAKAFGPLSYIVVRTFQNLFPNPNLMDGETEYEHPVERLRQLEMNYIDILKSDEVDDKTKRAYVDQIKIIRDEVKKMEKIWAPAESRFMLRLMKKISSFSSGLLANANLVADYAALQRLTKHFIQNPVYYHAQALKNVIRGSSHKG